MNATQFPAADAMACRVATFCTGLLTSFGLSLAHLLRLRPAPPMPRQEIPCILLWLDGGPSHLDTFIKARRSKRGAQSVQGHRHKRDWRALFAHPPLTAKMMREVALIRSAHAPGLETATPARDLLRPPPTPALEYRASASPFHETGFGAAIPPYVAIQAIVGGNSNTARAGYLPRTFSAFNVDLILRACVISIRQGVALRVANDAKYWPRSMASRAASRELRHASRDAFYEQATVCSPPQRRKRHSILIRKTSQRVTATDAENSARAACWHGGLSKPARVSSRSWIPAGIRTNKSRESCPTHDLLAAAKSRISIARTPRSSATFASADCSTRRSS
jgi:hypothetical protein